MSRITELHLGQLVAPCGWGNTACAQAVVLARLLGLMHVCLHAYVVAYVCTYPSAVEKVSLAAASRCATWTCSCVLFCQVSSWVSPVEWTQSREGDLGLGGTCAFVSWLHVCSACFQCQRFACVNCTFCCTGQLWVRAPPSASLWRGGKYCLRSSCCACQAFRPYACMPTCICCCLCLHLPICSRKSVPCCRFALCYMNLFMCFVLPSFLLSKSRQVGLKACRHYYRQANGKTVRNLAGMIDKQMANLAGI